MPTAAGSSEGGPKGGMDVDEQTVEDDFCAVESAALPVLHTACGSELPLPVAQRPDLHVETRCVHNRVLVLHLCNAFYVCSEIVCGIVSEADFVDSEDEVRVHPERN